MTGNLPKNNINWNLRPWLGLKQAWKRMKRLLCLWKTKKINDSTWFFIECGCYADSCFIIEGYRDMRQTNKFVYLLNFHELRQRLQASFENGRCVKPISMISRDAGHTKIPVIIQGHIWFVWYPGNHTKVVHFFKGNLNDPLQKIYGNSVKFRKRNQEIKRKELNQ